VGCCWADFDNDGDQDVFVVYYGRENCLYRNTANHTFSQVPGALGGENSVSAAWFDYDNDTHLDLYVIGQNEDQLYRSNGDGTFSAVDMQAAGLGESPGGFGLAWGDFDNDGYPDLYKTRGETGQPDINVLYRGQAGGAFIDFTYESGSIDPGEYRGAAWLDYDRNGRLDLILNNHSGKLRLYRNVGLWENNHYLRIRLVGTRSNADGIGAEVTVTFNGQTHRQDMGTGTGFTGQSEPVLHFGLGPSTAVDTLVVSWPNGIVQTLFELAADQVITINERDVLYPLITRHDTIVDQYQIVSLPVLTCSVQDRDSLTLVQVRYRTAEQESFTTVSMVRDSVSTVGPAFVGHWHYTMPSLPAGSTNLWRIVASGPRGSTDTTDLFQYTVNIDSVAPQISFIDQPGNVLPDTIGPYNFLLRFTDNTGVAQASFVMAGRTYQGDTIDLRSDTVFLSPPDSVDWWVSAPGVSLGSYMEYHVLAVDMFGNSDNTATDSIRVSPLPGKSNFSDEAVNLADLMRLVYLVLDVVEEPGLIDTMGLDLDRNGYFDTIDLVKLLDIWHQSVFTQIMLASEVIEAEPVIASLFDLEETESVFHLENSMYLPYGVVELAIEPPVDVRKLKLTPGNRLAGLLHLERVEAESGSIVLLFAAPPGGKGLAPGAGPLLTINASKVVSHRISIKRVHMGGQQVVVDRNLKYTREALLPKSFALAQNVPNPFNPSTTIHFGLPTAQEGQHQVRLTIYNLRGQTVFTLVDGSLNPGYHSVVWNGIDRHGKPLSSGIYFYRLQVNGQIFTRKMILLK